MSMFSIGRKVLSEPIIGFVKQAGTLEKTIKVQRSYQVIHPVVPKAINKDKIYVVHDEGGNCKIGDMVEIRPAGRRISAKKTYEVVRIIPRREDQKTNLRNAKQLDDDHQ
ncbi:30S ribosomal protein S17 [Phakopsora pachyrhizi]|uniref:30S ribosomal protein S17 n=1 Tax=Phakopsora pachyrhizi TaxID=170000 RepID=A0AAV0BSI1_PHAPC|nr:30S ribosomal protein S17 [Phakopsora pachyrhizi]CAH7689243.1 30S ribosomal protein S17 [Phakopsora pachyrhizi]